MKRQQEELMGGPLGEAGLNRAKKTPEELAAEAAAADQDDFTSKFLSQSFSHQFPPHRFLLLLFLLFLNLFPFFLWEREVFPLDSS